MASASQRKGTGGRRKAPSVAPAASKADQAAPFDPRSRQTIERILRATLGVIQWRGTVKMSMSDVCAAAKVSRTTLYRYFPHKEDLLEGLGQHHRREFAQAVRTMEKAHPEPVDRFLATIDLLQYFLDLQRMAHILLIEPQFAVNYINRHSPYFVELVQAALEPVFDAVESRMGRKVDRTIFTEMLFRIVHSAMIMPEGEPLRRYGEMILEGWFPEAAATAAQIPQRAAAGRGTRSAQ